MLQAGHAEQRRDGGSGSSTVLLVEEDSVVRKSLMRALASEGFLIQGTDPGVRMEAALKRRAYHAVLVSVEDGMNARGEEPSETGPLTAYRRRSVPPDWSRIQRVRRLHPEGWLVVLTMTAARLSSAAVEVEGVDAFVEKPVTVAALVTLLREMLGEPGANRVAGVSVC